MNKNVVFCRNIHWNTDIRISTHKFAEQFIANGWHCGWISRTMTPWRALYPSFRKARMIWFNGGMYHSDIYEYCPLFLLAYASAPILRSKALWNLSPRLTIPRVKRIMRSVRLDYPYLCWIGSLSMGALGKFLHAKHTVYHAHDAFSLYPSVGQHLRSIEAEIIRISTLTITTAVSTKYLLQNTYPNFAERIHTITHGVDIDRYLHDPPEPPDLAHIPHPRAVVLGSLNIQNLSLLELVCKALPDVSIVCIGPATTDLLMLSSRLLTKNLFILGPRPQELVPAYLDNCDVGLIAYPFDLIDSRLFGTNPMKRYEYAAAGLPTVSINLREYQYTPSPMYIAKNRSEFVDCVKLAVQDGDGQRSMLLDFARNNSWHNKYQQLLHILDNTDNNK